MFVHHMRAPLGRRHPDHNKYAVVLEAIKAKPVGGRPMGGAPSLDRSCARRPLGVWVGAKKRLPRIAVETVIAHRPPHRSVRAQLRHTVLTLSV